MIKIIQSPLLQKYGFSTHGFTTRTGGSSLGPYQSLNLSFDVGDDEKLVNKNLLALEQHLSVGLPLLRVKQTHDNTVANAQTLLESEPTGFLNKPLIEADAIFGHQQPAILAVQTADCVPILIADPVTKAVAAVHAGWKSLQKGIIRNTVRKFVHLNTEPQTLIAAVGPRICLNCYEVGEEVAKYFPESSDPIKGQKGKYQLDLAYAAEACLIGAGLTSINMDNLNHCNSCESDDFFSYRKSGGTCGRGLAFIGYKK